MKETNMSKFQYFLAFCISILNLTSFCAAQDLDSRDRERDAKYKDSLAIDIVGLKKGMFVGEVGAGDGYFTLMLANRVGPEGRVYANDIIEKGALEVIKHRARKKNIKNIITILGTEETPNLPEGKLDMVFIVLAFHDFTKPVKMLCNIATSLKPSGKLVIIDFTADKSPGTSDLRVFNRQDLQEWVNQSPFTFELIDDKSLPQWGSAPNVIFVLSLKKKQFE